MIRRSLRSLVEHVKVFTPRIVAMAESTFEPEVKKPKNSGPLPLSSKLIWVDCEMTGLDPEINRICEIALIITEGDLTPIATFEPLIIKQTPEAMENMSKWCKKTFKKNGLLEKIEQSQIDTATAEERVLEFLQQYTEPFTCALAGNSVSLCLLVVFLFSNL